MPRSITRRSTRTPLWFAALHLGLAGPVRLLGHCRPLCCKGERAMCLARFEGIHGAVICKRLLDPTGLCLAVTSERSSVCISFLSCRGMGRCARPCCVESAAQTDERGSAPACCAPSGRKNESGSGSPASGRSVIEIRRLLRRDSSRSRTLQPAARHTAAPYCARSAFLSSLPTLVLANASTNRIFCGTANFEIMPFSL
jgi:hypothetical protein